MEFSFCNYTRNPNIDFKFVSSLYFTKDLHCEIVNRIIGNDLVLDKEPITTDYGEVYVIEPDFHLISSKDVIKIYWLNLDYERIKEYNDKIVNCLGVSKYYWDIHDGESGNFIAECRSGVFELDGEISVSDFVARKFANIMDSLPEDYNDNDDDGYISDDYVFYGERIRVLRIKNPKNENESVEEYEARIDKLGREWLAADNANANDTSVEKEEKEIPLEKMCDIDIIKFIEKLGREPRDECDHWKFTYDPTNPCLARFSYGTFNNCTIPCRVMCFGKEFPLIIRGATFTNVDFGLCLFRHVIFMDCSFNNCDFSKSRIIHLTFDACQINNTDIKYENVIVNDLELEDM